MVINETLRLFPPVGISFRQCTKDYKMPNGCTLKKGTEVQVHLIYTHTEFCIPTECKSRLDTKYNLTHQIKPSDG